jgi:hypothetical protein
MPKPRKKIVLASYCNNILNHKTKRYILKYLFHARYNMSYILILVNEGIAKFFTLIVKSHLNKVMEFKCNTCIIMGYFHSSWNIKIFCEYLIPHQYIMKFMFSKLVIYLTIWFNIYKNECNGKLVTLMAQGFRF